MGKRLRSSNPPQPTLLNSDQYKENYDAIDWSKPYSEEFQAELDNNRRVVYDHTPVKGIPAIRTDKPHVSDGMKVHPEQVKRFNKQCVQGVHYNAKGQLVSTSSAAREREARRRGKSFG